MTYHGGSQLFSFDAALWMQLQSVAQRSATSLFSVLMSCFHVFLHRFTGQRDILVCPLITTVFIMCIFVSGCSQIFLCLYACVSITDTAVR